MRSAFITLVAVCLAVVLSTGVRSEDIRGLKLNQGTVGLLASDPDLSGNALEIANAIDHTEGLRVLPMIGRGSLQSINDLLFLRGVDVALLSSDSLAYARNNDFYKDETGRLAYIAKLANVNVIVLARKEFTTVESLAGLKIAAGPANSDEFVAAELLFGALDLSYERVASTGKDSLSALRDGRVAAAVFTGAQSQLLLQQVKPDSGLHIISVPLPAGLAEAYSPAILSPAEFPNLIAEGAFTETVAAALILAVFDWPDRSERFYKLRKFNKALLSTYFASLNAEQSTNFSAAVPGWKQYRTAKDLLSGKNPIQDSLTATTLQ